LKLGAGISQTRIRGDNGVDELRAEWNQNRFKKHKEK
jgi:hypothetical protein